MFQSSLPPGLEVCMGVHTEIPSLERTEEKEVRSRTDYYTITAEPRCTLYRIYIIFICTWVYTNVWAHMFIYEYIYIFDIFMYICVCVIFLEVCQHDFWGPIFQWKEMKSKHIWHTCLDVSTVISYLCISSERSQNHVTI